MKIGLVGYQAGGKSTVFELLTGQAPDIAKVQSGQMGSAVIPDERFDRLVEHYQPKKVVPARIDLFDTPGLDRDRHEGNAQRLGIIRESAALVHVIGVFAGADPIQEVEAFNDDLVLADLQVVSNRIKRLEVDVTKPRPDREELKHELELLQPLVDQLESGESLVDAEFTAELDQLTRSFSLLTRRKRVVVLNTAESTTDETVMAAIRSRGFPVLSAPVGLELEVQALPEDERSDFAAEMGLERSCREELLKLIFDVTDQITFYTSGEKEVHAWLLKRGSNVVEAAHTIHSDLARGFVRAEIWSADDLLRLGSERDLKAAGLHHIEGKDYIVQDGDEVFIRSGI